MLVSANEGADHDEHAMAWTANAAAVLTAKETLNWERNVAHQAIWGHSVA